MNLDKSSGLRRVVAAPAPSHPGLWSSVLNVDCADDEDVDWHWTESSAGRFVSGYTIVPRRVNPAFRVPPQISASPAI